jgi:hypothetical protein
MVPTATLILFAVHAAASFLPCQAATSGQGVLDWIQSKPNGFVSDKIAWRKGIDEDGGDDSYGFFAVEDIPKGTHLMIIPRSAILGPGKDKPRSDCHTVESLLKEYEKGEESDYYPYVNYLVGDVTKRGIVPSSWTLQGRRLLRRLVGRKLEPQEATGYECATACPNVPKNGGKCSVLETAAYFSIISRVWNSELIPGACVDATVE